MRRKSKIRFKFIDNKIVRTDNSGTGALVKGVNVTVNDENNVHGSFITTDGRQLSLVHGEIKKIEPRGAVKLTVEKR